MVKKYINTTIHRAPYLEKDLKSACTSGGRLQLVSYGEVVGGALSEVGETAVTPDPGKNSGSW